MVLLGGCARNRPPTADNIPPQAVATIAVPEAERLLVKFSSGRAPLTVRFDGSRSHDEDGHIVKFHWDFGDGTASEEERPTHTYTEPGEYAVMLTVTDDRGATGRDSLTVLVLSPEEEGPRPQPRPGLDGTIGEREYKYGYRDQASGMELHWTISGELIYLGLVGPATGWIGIGLAVTEPETGMEGLDLILGSVVDGQLVVRDDYGDAPFHHASDGELGGRNDILAGKGSSRDGLTTLELVRKMNTEDKFDLPIINGWMVVALAYSNSDDPGQQHDRRTMVRINFFTGKVRPLAEVGD
jgi:hypothetical protein